MRTFELAEFLIAKIEARTVRIRKATEDKNVNFDIKQFKEVSKSDLQTAAEVTEKLIQESEDKESCDEIGKKFLKVQQELEEAVDAYEQLMQQKWSIVLSQICSNVIGSCLSASAKKTANYNAYSIKLNKWSLLSQVVTIIISIACWSFQHILNIPCYHDYYWQDYYYEECHWMIMLLPPRRTLAFGSAFSMLVCVVMIILDFICASSSIRAQLEGCLLCSDLISAATLCIDWVIMLITSVFTFRFSLRKNYSSQKRYSMLALVLSSIVILMQAALFVIKLVRKIRRKLKKRAQKRMMGIEAETWGYSGMLNTQEQGDQGQLTVTHVDRQ